MKKKYISVLMLVLVTGMTACSSVRQEDTTAVETYAEPKSTGTEVSDTDTPDAKPSDAEAPNAEASDTKTPDAEAPDTEAPDTKVMNDRKEDTTPEDTAAGEPITGIVEKYAENIIVIKDECDGITYYFSTEGAQVAEGTVPIAVGDEVEITYQGLLGDEAHPGTAVKIVAR